jgi:hypothetical protein
MKAKRRRRRLENPATVAADDRFSSGRSFALLRMTEADVLAFEAILRGAGVAAADHRFFFAKLAPGDQTHRPAPRTGHDCNVWILRMTKLGLVFEKENRAGVHLFGDPFFKELQVGIHAASWSKTWQSKFR